MALHLHQWDREAKLEENQCRGQVTGWKRAIQGFRSTYAEADKPAEINHAVDLLFEVQVGISSKLIEIQA